MTKKVLFLFASILFAFSLVACGGKKVESISVVNSSVSSDITTSNVYEEILKIELEVKYTNGESEKIHVAKEMISDSDYQRLKDRGNYQIALNYSGCTTTLSLTVNSNNYSVVVQYLNGSPATGVTVQWCSKTNCFLPIAVDSEGYVEKDLEDGTYYVHIDGIPSGYTYNPNAYTTTASNKHLTIVLEPLLTFASGDGTKANPFVVDLGTYALTFSEAGAKNAQYFSYTATKNGTVNLFSTAVDVLAVNEIDPYVGYIGETDDLPNFSLAQADVSGNTEAVLNFNYSFSVEEGKTYYFLVFVSRADSFDASFNICLK